MPALLTSSRIARVALARLGRGDALDRLAVADVADLVLAAELLGERSRAGPRGGRAGRSASRAPASRRASAAPIPLEAPVTTATGRSSTCRRARSARPTALPCRAASRTTARQRVPARARGPCCPGRRVEPRGRPCFASRSAWPPSKKRHRADRPRSSSPRRRARRRSRRRAARRAASHVTPGPADDAELDARKRRVRHDVVADRVDVLRLLEVGGDRRSRVFPTRSAGAAAGSGKTRGRSTGS